MNQNNKKKKSEDTPNKKTINNSLSRYEKLNLIVFGFGHILTLVLVFVAIKEFKNVKGQYELNIDQFEKSIEQYNSNCEQQKKDNTIKYLQSLHELLNNTNDTLLEILKYYDIVNDTTGKMIYGDRLISRDSLNTILKDNHLYRKQLDDLYNGFNQFAIGCREGFFDEMTAWSANGNMIFNVTKALIPYYELIEKERGYPANQFVGCFLRVMAFRWEHDKTIGTKYNNMLRQLSQEAIKATNDSMPIIRRMPVVNE